MNLLCKIGLHRDWPEDTNVVEWNRVIYRTFMRCTRCRRWGRNTFFEEILIDPKAAEKPTKYTTW